MDVDIVRTFDSVIQVLLRLRTVARIAVLELPSLAYTSRVLLTHFKTLSHSPADHAATHLTQ